MALWGRLSSGLNVESIHVSHASPFSGQGKCITELDPGYVHYGRHKIQ